MRHRSIPVLVSRSDIVLFHIEPNIRFLFFLSQGFIQRTIYFPNDEYHPKILCFTANYSSKNFVAQIYKFYFQQKPHVRLFFIFNLQFRTNYSAFGTPSQKKLRDKNSLSRNEYIQKNSYYNESRVLRASRISVLPGSNSSILFQ